MQALFRILDHLDSQGGRETSAYVAVEVHRTEGSVPREVGTVMVVGRHDFFGTIGGGHLEYEALEKARSYLAVSHPLPGSVEVHRYALGPKMGQCCGGVVWLQFQIVTADQLRALARADLAQRPQVAIFGGGHVGEALVQQLLLLSMKVHWVDSREDGVALAPGALRLAPSPLLSTEHCDPVQDAVADLPACSKVVIMSFSHAEDLDIVEACLRRQRARSDLAWIGLIGSQSKWASFRHRLVAKGFNDDEVAQVVCPIGSPVVRGKEPAVIALAVAVQLEARPYPLLSTQKPQPSALEK
jgi:xanthine dehydrogenase accessory factor